MGIKINLALSMQKNKNSFLITKLKFNLLRKQWLHYLITFFYVIFFSVNIFANKLINMEVVQGEGKVVNIYLSFDEAAPTASWYKIDNPASIAIDLPNTQSALPKYKKFNFNRIQGATILDTGERTRLIIQQKMATSLKIKNKGKQLVLSLVDNKYDAHNKASLHENSTSPAYHQDAYEKGQTIQEQVKAIDFRRGASGEGNVIVTLADDRIQTNVKEVAGRIFLEFTGNVIPKRLLNRLDVTDFATPVQYIDTQIKAGNGVLIVEPVGQYDYLVYQSDNKLTISVKPLVDDKVASANKTPTYKGDKLSFDFQDISIRSVLQLIADLNNMNLVASDTVTGNITLRLKHVPWDQALDIVLKAKGLDKRLEGNVMTVAPADEIAAREKQQLENAKQIRELAAVYTDLIPINYADAKNIAMVLNGGGSEDDSLLTDQGSVQVVERTNSLLVKDTRAKLDEIRELLKKMDVPVKQVLIEARIVTLSTNYSKELGVKWSGGQVAEGGKILMGGRGADFQLAEGTILDNGAGFKDSLGASFDGTQTFTDLSVTGSTAAALGIGFVTNGTLLNLELSALLSDGGGEIISQPKVITADKQTARIKAGKQIPYTEAASSGATTVAFQDALLSLEVTPQITPEGRVIMDIKITNDDSTENTESGIPIIEKNEIVTQVLIEDGETVVLGGVFKQTKKNNEFKVPLLGDIPVIGSLFRKTTEKNDKSELMVFITPRIIAEEVLNK